MNHMHIDPAGAVRPMSPNDQQAAARARSERLMRDHHEYVKDALEFTPTWAGIAEDCSESSFSVEANELLAETAPHEYWQAWYLARAQLLREIRSLTERSTT